MKCKTNKLENKLKLLKAQKRGDVRNTVKYSRLLRRSVHTYKSCERMYGDLLIPEKLIKKGFSKNVPKLSGITPIDKQITTCEWSLDTWKKLKKKSESTEKKLAYISIMSMISLNWQSLACLSQQMLDQKIWKD